MQSQIDYFLIEQAHKYRHDPFSFVKFAWEVEPRSWQADVLKEIGRKLKLGITVDEAVLEAVASGHGIGKSCLVAWILLWSLTTLANTRGVVTANTEAQLKTKTWAEIGKWFNTFKYKKWFKFTATAIYSVNPEQERTWRIDMAPWSERNTEAFAGMHNKGKRAIVIFDEASSIPEVVWEVTEGALTDENTEIIWLAFGNPTRNSGRFRHCFGRLKHRWGHRQIDSRDVVGTNKKQINNWIDDYGDDSDFVRVRVKGQFPRAGSRQFISSEWVDQAVKRKVKVLLGTPKILSVDVARFGDDQSVIAMRHGRKLEKLIKFRGLDTMQLSSEVAGIVRKTRPDAIFVDGVGVGGGVVDRLRQLNIDVIDVNGGMSTDHMNKDTHLNKRAEMWDRMREWIEGADIPDDKELIEELTGIEYSYDNKMRLAIEKKEDMKRRGMSSPDCADAISLGFFSFVMPLVDSQQTEPEYFYDS